MKKFEALEEIQKKKAETNNSVSNRIHKNITMQNSNDNGNEGANEDEQELRMINLCTSGVLDDDELHELLNAIGTVFDELSSEGEYFLVIFILFIRSDNYEDDESVDEEEYEFYDDR